MNKNQGKSSNRRQGSAGRNREEKKKNFKLDISEEDMLTGTMGIPRTRAEQNTMYNSSQMHNKKLYYTEKEKRAEQKEHKKRNKIKAGKNKRVFSLVWLAMVIMVSLSLSSYLIMGANDFLAKDRKSGSVDVNIPENVDSETLGRILQESGAINRAEFFTLYAKLTAEGKGKIDQINKGTYDLRADMDYEEIINVLGAGEDEREVVTITFTEGLNAYDIAQKLDENGVCTKEDALKAMNEMDFTNYMVINELGNNPDKDIKLEGYLFPDTFDFYKGEDLGSVFGKLLNNFQSKTYSLEDDFANSGMTRDQIIILASIIQAEAADSKDMYMISAILHNRLNYGADYGVPMLQCDSTMFYPYHTSADVPESAGGSSYKSKYNTYEITGLPASAICNPGLNAIKAALNPSPDGDGYLYFCHSKEGKAYYATNIYDHEANMIEAGIE